MRPSTLPPLLGLAASLVACGGRSSLDSGAAGTSGTGGATASCDALLLAGPPIGTPPDALNDQIEPALTFTAEGSVAAIFGQKPAMVSKSGPPAIAAVALDAWGAWPAELGASFIAASAGGSAFAAAPSFEQGLSLFLNPMEVPPFGEMFLAPSVPLGIASPALGALLSTNDRLTRTLFLIRGASRYLAGSAAVSADSEQLLLSVIEAGPKVAENFVVSGCATQVAASAIAEGDSFLIALSSSLPLGQCPGGPVGAATQLQLARWSPAAPQSLAPGANLSLDDTLLQVALVPRSDGAWLVWQTAGNGALERPPVAAMRVDQLGDEAGPMISVDSGSGGPFVAAALGDRLAVGWVKGSGTSAPELVVSLLDESGAALPGASVSTVPQGLGAGRLAALGRPEGDKLLLAWSTLGEMGPTRVQVARFDCAPK